MSIESGQFQTPVTTGGDLADTLISGQDPHVEHQQAATPGVEVDITTSVAARAASVAEENALWLRGHGL